MSDGAETPCVLAVDGVDVLRYVAGMQERPVADHAVALVATSAVVNAVFDQLPGHWFTSEDDELLDALLAAIPEPDPSRRPDSEKVLGGEIPSPLAPPSGCRFRTRCPKAQDLCAEEEPQIRPVGDGQFVACHFPMVDVPD